VSVYVTDTHPLIWYASSKHAKLSIKALKAFDKAFCEQALIYIPAFVFWEISLLIRVGRISPGESYESWVERLCAHPGFKLAVVDAEVLIKAHEYAFQDPFDAGIVATAAILDIPLITRDQDIAESRRVEIFW